LQLQDALDRYVQNLILQQAEERKRAEYFAELLADYLLHYSDLFQDDHGDLDEWPLSDWERDLHSHMNELMDGDTEPAVDLHGLELDRLEAEHLRDFFGWYLLRELNGETATLSECFTIMRGWLNYLAEKAWIDTNRHLEFLSVLDEMQDECERTSKAAHLLFHFVRMGSGISPRLRGQRFSRFVEGHARIARLRENQIFLSFDSQPHLIGPVPIIPAIADLLKIGDVLDVELGKRGDLWLVVDIGPVYPANVYVEAEEFEPVQRLS